MASLNDKQVPRPGHGAWRYWSKKKKILIAVLILMAIVAIAVGLGVGLGIGLKNRGSSGGEQSVPPSTPPTSEGNTTAKWQPPVRTTWQIELLYPLNDTSIDVDVYDIDLFDNNATTISTLHGKGHHVICYFSAGTYENWRPDKSRFKDSDLGKALGDWHGERWLNVNSTNVRDIMVSRLDLARQKGCDGVDPDNVDGYDNDNGLGLTEADSVNYVNFLANETHARNMSIGLKNAGAIIPWVIGNMQWSVNEQCAQYHECDTYLPFIEAGKPVFHIEYPKGGSTNNDILVSTSQKNNACLFNDSRNFSTIIKNMDLDNWVQNC
ncbi:endo alpha-1,4 polygalactosaminidase, putative [Paecilomyces variotii No. 5]|uniref:alpha-galactosidase n=1 Tax=Byssochlamys spectabilis (strain No. 5 / NBRC 109023) TaxID=1356009 RepID=V5G5G4_BYSSN|nr:endo alpha-1,4 polygalactosaminidase, putative [Paecilomyces variotii No. 5]